MKITPSEYAKKAGWTRQHVTRLIRAGRLEKMKGVKEVETIHLANKQIIYLLNYEPDEKAE